jgi:hypothetical protein
MAHQGNRVLGRVNHVRHIGRFDIRSLFRHTRTVLTKRESGNTGGGRGVAGRREEGHSRQWTIGAVFHFHCFDEAGNNNVLARALGVSSKGRPEVQGGQLL